MKKFLTSLILIGLVFITSSFIEKPNPSLSEKALSEVSSQFHNGLDDLELAISQLYKQAQTFNNIPADIQKLQSAHLDTRLAFKKIEYLLEYYDRHSVKKMLNGAPLLSVEPKVPELTIIEPCGLQVLDELIFGEDIFNEKTAILKNCKKLKSDYQKINIYQHNIKITHRHIFEATRQELIRIFTLGLTGFDTPGSVNAIPEAQSSLKSLSEAMKPYTTLVKEKDAKLANHLDQLFTNAVSYLESNQDFDTFDRMVYLKNFIDPLYAKTYQLHKTLGIETARETNQPLTALTYESVSIFDPEFLNRNFYANIDLNQEVVKDRIELGKLLFFDPILSDNLERSCASCHQPEKAFTDGLPKSLASNGKGHISRNAPTIINSVYSERYFYDLREPSLERQIKHVVKDSMEFSTDFFAIMKKLKKSDAYKKLFEAAYPEYPKYTISKWSISDALACYVSSISSFNSPVDQYIRGEVETIDPDVVAGFNLFMGKAACGTCHFAPTFNGSVPPFYEESESEVLGVPISTDTLNPQIDPDMGRAHSKRPLDGTDFYKHSFKTVTVRNIAETAPYMHNGVYETLEEVIDFYNKGGGIGLGMDVPYQTLPDTPLNLTKKEQEQLIAFMEALSDNTIDTSKPTQLPVFENQPEWNNRTVGGKY